MKYMMLTYGTEEVYDLENLTDDQRRWMREMVAFMHDLDEELRATGELVSAEGLAGPAGTRTVRPAGDDTVTTDGPYAEAKEFLAGFWILDVASFERVEEIAARLVRYLKAPIELREIGEAPQV